MQMVLRGTLRVVLAVFVFFSLVFPQPVHAQGGEILISTPAELEMIRSNLAGSYRLVADIDLSAYSNWVPLGQVDSTTTAFTGSLIGDGHAIRNMVLANTQLNNQGLFGIIGPGAQVSSLRIENARVTAANSAGILAGTNEGNVTGVSTEGIVSGGTVVGGLVGTNTGTITQSFAIAAVSGLDQNGGLVGSNTGAISETYSASSVSAAVTNNYIQFDGTDDYISIPHRDEYITDSFTLEAWFQWGDTDTSVTSFIIGKGLENFEIHTGGGSYENGIRFIPVLRSMTEFNDARAYQDVYQVLKPGWNHVAATWDYAHEQVRVSVNGVPQPIYQNGVDVGTAPSLPIPDAVGNPLAGNTKHFFIGARNDRNTSLGIEEYPHFFFKGNISDVRFWNIVRTPEQIAADKYKQLTGNEPGLMGYWKLDETSGDTVIDSSYLHNNGTLLGNAIRRQVVSSNGGLVAVNTAPGTVTNSYYDSTVAGAAVTANGYGTPLTTAQMKSSGSFTGWVFPGTWKILEDRTYPTLFTYPAPVDITSIAPSPASSGHPYTVSLAASHYIGALANPVSVADGDGHNCSITIPAFTPYTGSCGLTPTNQGSATVTASYAGDAVFTSGSDAQALTVNDGIAPSVTVNQASGQADPASSSPIHFTAVFSEPIDLDTFTAEDVTISGTAGASAASIAQIAPNDGTTFDISVTGMNTPGTVIAAIGAGIVQDLAGNANTASTSTDNQVTSTIDLTPPSVTVNQATGQADPTGTS
ncbi:MAG TPA: LamG-like jellyroll fold domain-containing protein, partial [Anaerolineaceae bacterium]|nr:LamG-like jellyroll fold domain-containing protein [Anaerolineaceae bacterium]